MRTVFRFVLGLCVCVSLSAAGYAAGIEGDYLETRSADVYTGPCFANGEVSLRGNQAILAWKVRHGSWNGIALDGLSVVGVVRASATLGDPYDNPYPAHAVLLVDENATAVQKRALVDFARSMGGRLFDDVVAVRPAPISMEQGEAHGITMLKAGDVVSVQTRSLTGKDHHCGNEITYYPPLTGRLSHSMPVVAVANQYSGDSLGTQWRLYNRRSAFIGTFAAQGESLSQAE